MNHAVLLLGSNLGEQQKNLDNACVLIEENAGKIISFSSVYKTEPWGYASENWFYNRVIKIETTMDVFLLFEKTCEIEKKMGRSDKTEMNYTDRLIDIDILFFDNLILKTTRIEIPHPRLHLRKFTLIPLVEIMPDFVHPVFNKTIKNLLEECEDPGKVAKTVSL